MKRARRNERLPPRSLLAEWPEVTARLRRAEGIALFLDFDGTLVEFKRNPKAVRLDARTRRMLERLARHPRIMLAFISGRRRADLNRRVGVRGAYYLGLHGFESRSNVRVSAASRRCLVRVHKILRGRIHGLAGVWLEDKKACLALHYRGAAAGAVAKARAAARQVLKTERTPLRVLRGKKILELLAPEIEGKGAAAAGLVRSLRRRALPVYFGDDATDESAFTALRSINRVNALPAVTVLVGRGKRTWARYRVRDVHEVKVCLERLAAALA